MEIDRDLLTAYGGVAKKYEKGSFVFHQGDMPLFFYHIITGEVKIISANKDGKELTQGYFGNGSNFGEPPLLLNKPYPSTAEIYRDAVIIRITKERFMHLLDENNDITRTLLYQFASRIYTKAVAINLMISKSPEEKISGFLDKVKNDLSSQEECYIPFTRQEIADASGLRVETVIRTLMRMSKSNKVKIINHKLYY